jgi:hypothetical protein
MLSQTWPYRMLTHSHSATSLYNLRQFKPISDQFTSIVYLVPASNLRTGIVWPRDSWIFSLPFSHFGQRRLDSRPQSIMGIERLIPRVTSLTVDCRGVNISLTKPIWKLSNDKSVRLRYFVKRNSMLLLYCCDHHYDLCFAISSLPFLNYMGRAVILAL